MELPKVPQWLTVAVVIFLMAVVAYSVYNGYTVRFWPPEIAPQARQPTAPPSGPSSSSIVGSSTTPATAWEYQVVSNLVGRSDWRQDVEQLLNASRPKREHVFVAFSGGNDIHIWLLPGGGPTWRARFVDARADPRWAEVLTDLARNDSIVPIGFEPPRPDGPNKLWYLQANSK